MSLASKIGGVAGVEHGVDRPIFLRDEGADFLLALDDQAQRHGLHAPRGKSAAHFIPQQRRNFVAHDAIQNAAGLLRVYQVLVNLQGMLERGVNGLLA